MGALRKTKEENRKHHDTLGSTPLQDICGTISMVQQAIRYGNHYAATRVVLTDYLNAVLIEIPEFDKDGIPKDNSLEWIFLQGQEVRSLVSVAFWLSCRDWKTNLEIAEAEAEMADAQIKYNALGADKPEERKGLETQKKKLTERIERLQKKSGWKELE